MTLTKDTFIGEYSYSLDSKGRINIPAKLKGDSGKFVVSVGEEKDAIDTRINVKKIVDVVTGSLVLFPASLTHFTIPFESEEERIVLAFDVKQK